METARESADARSGACSTSSTGPPSATRSTGWSNLVRAVGTVERGPPPASVVLLGGDVHHAYLANVAFRKSAGVKSAVYQAVCSPYRNALDSHERAVVRFGASRPGAFVGRALARAAGVPHPEIRWRLAQSPTFDNQFATLELRGRSARMHIERIVPGDWDHPRIETSLERVLGGDGTEMDSD